MFRACKGVGFRVGVGILSKMNLRGSALYNLQSDEPPHESILIMKARIFDFHSTILWLSSSDSSF